MQSIFEKMEKKEQLVREKKKSIRSRGIIAALVAFLLTGLVAVKKDLLHPDNLVNRVLGEVPLIGERCIHSVFNNVVERIYRTGNLVNY